MTAVLGVCSAKSRPSVQNNHSKGSQWWRRDVWHAQGDDGKTLCGRDSKEYLEIGMMEIDQDFCLRCAKEREASHITDERWKMCFEEPRELV